MSKEKNEVSKLTIKVDRDLYTRFKVQAAKEGRTMQDIASMLLENYLNSRKNEGGIET